MSSGGVIPEFLSNWYTVITSGLGGIGLLGFFFRWIVPGTELQEMREDRDQWKALYEKEREAHQATRDAFTAASQRGDAAIETARVATALIEAFRREPSQ